MPDDLKSDLSAAGVLLSRLKAIGVDYIFANSGTDFPPIIEALAAAREDGTPLPQTVIAPHEHAAMGMAHGYTLVTGRPQAVMAHTNVGLANCATGAINAAIERVPLLLFSGRTPTTEQQRFGARTVPIGWGQEMRDQTALVREASKWDYELRFPEQMLELTDRAYAISSSTPKGPVYVSLPREVLCQPAGDAAIDAPLTMAPVRLAPPPEAIAELARLIALARFPVIFAQHGAGTATAFDTLQQIVERWAIPVCQYWAVQLALPTGHPMAAPADPAPLLAKADLVIVLDSLAPWAPDHHRPLADAKVVQLGPDPLASRTPVRNFRSDLSIACEVADGISALAAALDAHKPGALVTERRAGIVSTNSSSRDRTLANARSGADGTMSREWVSYCVSESAAGRNAIILSELGCPLPPMTLDHHQAWFQEPHAGGLGWSFPAALGMQLADRDRLVIATMGDGSYIFANPVACHQIAEAMQLPIVIVIINNAEWGAVRQSVLGLYPDGHAAKSNTVPLTELSPSPDFTRIAEASRAWSRRVTTGADLPSALADAIAHARSARTPALLDVRVRA